MNNPIIHTGGHVIHSYGRLVHREHVITRGDQLLPPGDVTGPGRMDCIRTVPEIPRFDYYRGNLPNNLVNQINGGDEQMATLSFNQPYFSMNTSKNVEGFCETENPMRDTYFYVYLLPGNTYY